jgi:hypothetical protein
MHDNQFPAVHGRRVCCQPLDRGRSNHCWANHCWAAFRTSNQVSPSDPAEDVSAREVNDVTGERSRPSDTRSRRSRPSEGPGSAPTLGPSGRPDKPLRRKVALAYRTAREAGKSHDRAFHAAGGGAVHSVITGPK